MSTPQVGPEHGLLRLELRCNFAALLLHTPSPPQTTHLSLVSCSSAQSIGYSAWSYGAIPLIYVFMMLIRGGCLTAFNPLFRLIKEREWVQYALF